MMCVNVDKDTTAVVPKQPGAAAEGESQEIGSPSPRPSSPSRPSKAAFLGQAMGALLQQADVQVQRGDQTRVLSRANEELAAVERRRPGSIDEALSATASSASSGPPRPRVDAALWVVLTAGLFAIVGWMLAYGL
jgi:hypothetical protein